MAAALVRGAGERGVDLADAEDFVSVTGKGVKGRVDGRAVTLGNAAMMADTNTPQDLENAAQAMRREGQTAMFVAVEGDVVAVLSVADPIKPTSAEAIRTLHREGLRVVMLTGDNETTARAVAAPLGIDEVVAGVLPDERRPT